MERLQKVLAHAGIASRRKCEDIIEAGRVMVNDEVVTTLGVKVDSLVDVIRVDGRVINREQPIYIAFNKPKGIITSSHDPEGRKTVIDFLKGIDERVYPVGRLDYDTEGLLILTNDGELANLLTHPRHRVPKTYHVTVKGVPHGNDLDKLSKGILLEDGMTAPAEAEFFDINPNNKEAIISITIREGKNRQVRRMFEAIHLGITKLKRIRFGSIDLYEIPRGRYRHLTETEVQELRETAVEDT